MRQSASVKVCANNYLQILCSHSSLFPNPFQLSWGLHPLLMGIFFGSCWLAVSITTYHNVFCILDATLQTKICLLLDLTWDFLALYLLLRDSGHLLFMWVVQLLPAKVCCCPSPWILDVHFCQLSNLLTFLVKFCCCGFPVLWFPRVNILTLPQFICP